MICLVRPPAAESFRFATTNISLPLGLAYVAGALEASGRSVSVFDAVAEGPTRRTRYIKGFLVGLSLDELAERIPADADWVGISVIFTHEWPAVVRLVELIKARHPRIPVVLGGEHVTSLPEFCLLSSRADIVVMGEGEETVVELSEALEAGRPLTDIGGLGYRDGERVVINPRRTRRRDVDSIPLPAWHCFDVQTYHQHRFVGGMYSPSMTIPMLATRGCPYQCTYCSSPNMWTPLWMPRDPVKVVDEIEHYVQTYGARNFPFQDLTAIIKKEWIVEFCTELLRRDLKITWQLPTGTRSEAIDAEVSNLLWRSGMISMAYAPESGSDTTRKLIKKKVEAPKLFDSIRAAVAANLNVTVFAVIGFPHDTPEQLAENLPFIDNLVESGVTDFSVGYYMALPGTELFHYLYDKGEIVLDRRYFSQTLQALALVPARSFCHALNSAQLIAWKVRLLGRFYQRRGRAADGVGFATSLRRAISGFKSGEHTTKLETAFRNGLTSAVDTFKAQFGKGWMTRREERALFHTWDATYRHIRSQKLKAGATKAAPTDSTELHRVNVATALRREHETPSVMSAFAGTAEAH